MREVRYAVYLTREGIVENNHNHHHRNYELLDEDDYGAMEQVGWWNLPSSVRTQMNLETLLADFFHGGPDRKASSPGAGGACGGRRGSR